MGCTFGRRRFIVNNNIEGQDETAMEIMTGLGFSQSDLDLLYTAFWDMDADSLIRPEELFAYFNVEGTPFEKRLFALFDEDKSGMINFMEFVCTLWNILTLPESDFGSVAYLLRDPTGKSNISFSDVRIILEMLHNKKLDKDPTLLSIFNQMKRELEIKLSIYEFNKWTAANPSVVAPLLMLQLHLRLQIIGEAFWIKLSQERSKHIEQGRLDYVRKLQNYVKEKNRIFRERQEEEEKKKRKVNLSPNEENLARKESLLLNYFHMKPNKNKKLSRIITRKAPTADPIHPADEFYKELHYISENESHQQQQQSAKSRGNSTEMTKSRGNSMDDTNNDSPTKTNKSSKKNAAPMILKYDTNNNEPYGTPVASPEMRHGKHNKPSPPTDNNNTTNHPGSSKTTGALNADKPIEDTKISSKHSEKKSSSSPSKKKKKDHQKQYQELVSPAGLKKEKSIFNIFDKNAGKVHYDVLDSDEELDLDELYESNEKLAEMIPPPSDDTEKNSSKKVKSKPKRQQKIKDNVPIRRKRSIIARPNLLKTN